MGQYLPLVMSAETKCAHYNDQAKPGDVVQACSDVPACGWHRATLLSAASVRSDEAWVTVRFEAGPLKGRAMVLPVSYVSTADAAKEV